MNELEYILTLTIVVALFAAFCVLLCKKWGWAEYMQVHGDKYLSQLFSCDLCMSFWACFLITLAIVVVIDEKSLMLIPFFATPITRQLV